MDAWQKKKKRRRTDCEAEAERKLRSKGKSCTKTNSCNPKVTVTDELSKEGPRKCEMASLERRLAKLCSLRAVEERVHRRRYKAFCESDMHRLSKQGIPDKLIRQQVLRIDEDWQQTNSQHHRRRLPCWTTTTLWTSKKNPVQPESSCWIACLTVRLHPQQGETKISAMSRLRNTI